MAQTTPEQPTLISPASETEAKPYIAAGEEESCSCRSEKVDFCRRCAASGDARRGAHLLP
jgi:hypothetical protein